LLGQPLVEQPLGNAHDAISGARPGLPQQTHHR